MGAEGNLKFALCPLPFEILLHKHIPTLPLRVRDLRLRQAVPLHKKEGATPYDNGALKIADLSRKPAIQKPQARE
jgi:hypothetical protein